MATQKGEADPPARAGSASLFLEVVLLEKKLNNNEFRYIEKLLYDYITYDTAIKELEAQLKEVLETMLPSPKASVINLTGGGPDYDEETGVCSEPERWAIKREDNLYVRFLRNEIEMYKRHKEAISFARERLNDEEEQFVVLFYDQNRPIRDCRRIMCYEKTKLYKLRQKIVYKVAAFLGIK